MSKKMGLCAQMCGRVSAIRPVRSTAETQFPLLLRSWYVRSEHMQTIPVIYSHNAHHSIWCYLRTSAINRERCEVRSGSFFWDVHLGANHLENSHLHTFTDNIESCQQRSACQSDRWEVNTIGINQMLPLHRAATWQITIPAT